MDRLEEPAPGSGCFLFVQTAGRAVIPTGNRLARRADICDNVKHWAATVPRTQEWQRDETHNSARRAES